MSWISAIRRALRPRQLGDSDFRAPQALPDVGETIDNLLSNIKPDAPGFGIDVHTPDVPADWPSAYALMASTNLALNATRAGASYLQRAHSSARWLVDSAGCASTLAPCWGVPYARMIWEDTKPALPGTAFAIPTCHTIQALDETASVVGERAEANRLRQAAARAAEHFAEHCCDVNGDEVVIWYSTLRQHSFHITNAIAMMAGQFQRASRFSLRADLLTERADGAVRYLLRRRAAGEAGSGWHYFGDRIPSGKLNKKNDLLHDAFVCHGLFEYKIHGGQLADEIDYEDLLGTLGRFFRDGSFYEFPGDEAVKSRTVVPARALGLGQALYVASRIHRQAGASDQLSAEMCEAICGHYVNGTDLFHRPGAARISMHVRDVTHVLFGLTEYERCSGSEPKLITGTAS